jgi:hypothetical protein
MKIVELTITEENIKELIGEEYENDKIYIVKAEADVTYNDVTVSLLLDK